MEVFNCRNPFIVSVNGDSSQIETKLELLIWGINESSPLTPNIVLQKTKYSDTQYINYYNISPYVYDLINPYNLDTSAYNVQVNTYCKLSGETEFNIVDTFNYISVNGYDDYNNGSSTKSIYGALPLLNPDVNLNINYFTSGHVEYSPIIDVIFDFNLSSQFRVSIQKGEYAHNDYIYASDYPNAYTMLRLFMTNNSTETFNGNDFIIEYLDGDTFIEIVRYKLTRICEQKYTPFVLDYVNNWGGLQRITLFKNSTQTIEVKSSDYNTNSFTSYPNYEIRLGQKRVFNKNGTTTIKCNTGWINEIENANIKDIMLSEYLLLKSTDNAFYNAVTLKNTSQLMKTHLNEKLINYELEFEVASKLINNVV